MTYTENKLHRGLPIHRGLLPLTLAEDGTLLDDRQPVTLSVGDLRYIIQQHEKALTTIGEMALLKSNDQL